MSWINWPKFLEENSELPSDVSFQVSEKLFPAHRFMLAAASPMFRAQFYGSLPDNKDQIIVEYTTPEAFAALLNFIYSNPGVELTWPRNFRPLFDLLKLADYYIVLPLVDLVKKEIVKLVARRIDMTMDNIFEAIEVAEDFKEFELSRDIMKECQKFLINNTSVEDLVELVTNENVDQSLFFKLFQGEKCPQCEMYARRCLNKKRVTEENLKIGAKIYPAPGKHHLDDTEGIGIITRKGNVATTFFSNWENNREREYEFCLADKFVYKCK